MQNKRDIDLGILKELIRDFEFNQHTLEAVIRREAADKLAREQAIYNSGYGLTTQQAYEGYSLLIRAFMAINTDSLSEQQLKQLKQALVILEILRQENLNLYLIDTKSYSAFRESEKVRIRTQLDQSGEIYTRGGYLLGSGSNRHHAIIKYSKEGDVYIRTEFNEGSGAELHLDNPKHVWGVNKRVVPSDKLAEVISIDVDTIFTNKHASEQILPLLEPRSKEDVEQSIITTMQIVGNCSTRTIRALLRSVLGLKMTRELYELSTSSFEHIKDQLALQLYEIASELPNTDPLTLLGELHSTLPKAAWEATSPIDFTKDMNVAQEMSNRLSDLIFKQAEHILNGTFRQSEHLEQFKKNLRESLLTTKPTETSFWAYLKPESIGKIAFIMANNLIDNQIIALSKDDDNSALIIDNEKADTILNRVTLEGIRKSRAPIFGAENDLGIDQAISLQAYNLTNNLQQRRLLSFSGDVSDERMKARFIAATKDILSELSEGYRIDLVMLKIIKSHLSKAIEVFLEPPFSASMLIKMKLDVLEATQNYMDNDVRLKELRIDVLMQPTPRQSVKRLEVGTDTGIGALLAQRETPKVNKTSTQAGDKNPFDHLEFELGNKETDKEVPTANVQPSHEVTVDPFGELDSELELDEKPTNTHKTHLPPHDTATKHTEKLAEHKPSGSHTENLPGKKGIHTSSPPTLPHSR